MKLLSEPEAFEILDYLERENLLSAQSRVLADIVRDGKCGTEADECVLRCGIYKDCVSESDGNFEGYVWDFDKIMSYFQIAFMPQLAEVRI